MTGSWYYRNLGQEKVLQHFDGENSQLCSIVLYCNDLMFCDREVRANSANPKPRSDCFYII